MRLAVSHPQSRIASRPCSCLSLSVVAVVVLVVVVVVVAVWTCGPGHKRTVLKGNDDRRKLEVTSVTHGVQLGVTLCFFLASLSS